MSNLTYRMMRQRGIIPPSPGTSSKESPDPAVTGDGADHNSYADYTLSEALKSACAEVGIVFRDVPADGRWHATDVIDDSHGRGDGRIRVFNDGGGGIVCNWKGETKVFFKDESRILTDAERADRDHKRQEAIRQASKEKARRKAEAAVKALALWRGAIPAMGDHPYLIRKGIKPTETLREITSEGAETILGYTPKSDGDLLSGRLLLAPVKASDAISSMEMIDEAGRKSAVYGGAKAGGYWSAHLLPDGDGDGMALLIGEGVATVLSAKEATGHPVVAALSCGNLKAIAKEMRDRYPAAQLVILADLGNGKDKSKEAAESVGAALAVPDFTPEWITKFQTMHGKAPTDFNDLHQLAGLDEVRAQIEAAIPEKVTDNAETSGPGGPGGPDATEATAGTGSSPTGSGTTPGPLGNEWSRDQNENGFVVNSDGVFWEETDDEGKPRKTAICKPALEIKGMTRSSDSEDWGRLVEFSDSDGVRHTWALPMEMLQGDGSEARRCLASMGLLIYPGTRARNLLTTYLTTQKADGRALCVDKTGWHENVFVLQDRVIGSLTEGEEVIFQTEHRTDRIISAKGSLEEWRDSIGGACVGNSRLTLFVSASFTGPLLEITGTESGGVHLDGRTSIGKTATTHAAASVWGKPSKVIRPWRATVNGLEGVAAALNDRALMLDEISQVDSREAAPAVYMLANGFGKQRATRHGCARKPMEWRTLVLSTGEKSLEDHAATSGKRLDEGAVVRLLNIPADPGAGYGVYEQTLRDRERCEASESSSPRKPEGRAVFRLRKTARLPTGRRAICGATSRSPCWVGTGRTQGVRGCRRH